MYYNGSMTKQDLGEQVWYDPDENGYIGLDLTKSIPRQSSQVVDGVELFPKDEFHCSLVATRLYTSDTNQEQSIAEFVKEYLETHQLVFVGLGDERYVCKKEYRTTIIAPVIIEGIEGLKDFVRTIIPAYQPPFSHVTLLKSKVTKYGIGINSINDLSLYCKKLD